MKKNPILPLLAGMLMVVGSWMPLRADSDPMTAYLFAYFTGNNPDQEQIRYAISHDGFNYMPLNDGAPIIASSEIANTGCVRDPHILRGNDGYFYMVATDMKSSLGWRSNHGLVLMRSTDLINWEHHAIDFQTKYPGTKFANAKYVWAPQTLWDESAGKYMIYFAFGDNDQVPYQTPYYVYANDDFTDLEGEPQMLFDRGSATIDMDIVLDDNDVYHCFYKEEGTTKGITQCTFAKADLHNPGNWNYNYSKISGDEAAEGSGVFRLLNGDWCLMWDCYDNGHYAFNRSTNLTDFTFVQYTATTGNFTPRHGTVIQITEPELRSLFEAFPNSTDGKMRQLLNSTNFYTAEAKEKYEDILADYADDPFNTVLTDPYVVTGWRAAATSDYVELLMSAWEDHRTDDWGGLHVNTWSEEGINDGSDFKVPFYEYWVGDGDALGNKTITGTVPGLIPNQEYEVTAQVRVRIKNNGGSSAYGISMQVGEGTAVDVCSGAQIGSSQFRMGNFKARGTADASGNLILKFIVNGTNVSWLSFRNVIYDEYVPYDVSGIRSNWMSQLPDAEFVANLSLPGSHDSGSSGMSASAKVQEKTIAEQLAAGIRVLDLRLNGSQKIAHGISSSNITFDQALGYVKTFLEQNPTEFVVVFTKAENTTANDSWRSAMKSTADKHASMIVPFHRNITVGEARGKMIMLNRDYFDSEYSYAFADNWGDNQTDKWGTIRTNAKGINATTSLHFQDNYDNTATGGADVKDNAIRALLDASTASYATHAYETTWFLNFTSGYTETNLLGITTIDNIKDCATRTNSLVFHYLEGKTGPTGMVMMDFACCEGYWGQALVDAIIHNNFEYLPNESVQLASLYNVGQDKYLTQGGAWGTRSMLGTYSNAIKMVKVGENSYKFHLIEATNGGDNIWLGTNYYLDASTTTWNLTQNADNTYTISLNNQNFGWTGSALENGASGDNAKWDIVNTTQLIERMAAANKNNGVNVTYRYINGPAYHRNNVVMENSWNDFGTATATMREDGGTRLAGLEFYNKDFEFSQTIYLPKGMYKLTVDGFYRYTGRANSITCHANGTEEINAFLFADEAKAPLMSIFDGKDVIPEQIVNNLTDALTAIQDGIYSDNCLWFYVDKDKMVTLGLKNTSHVGDDWCAFNNFGLVYYGQEYFEPSMSQEEWDALQAAIETAEGYALGFDKDEYAPYANAAAISALAAAKTLTADSSSDEAAAAIAAISLANWTANASEVDAIYNGDFQLCTVHNSAPAGWTTNDGHPLGGSSLPGVYVIKSGESNYAQLGMMQPDKTVRTAFYMRFDGSNSDRTTQYIYGETAGYEMPLKAGVKYRLTFDFGGWGNISDAAFAIIDEDGKQLGIHTSTPNAMHTDVPGKATHAEFVFTPVKDGNVKLVAKNPDNDQMRVCASNFSIRRATNALTVVSQLYDVTPSNCVTYNGSSYTANNIVLTDALPYTADKDITAASVTYNREFKNINTWQPLYLPFEVAYDEWTKHAVCNSEDGQYEAIEFAGVGEDGEGAYLVFKVLKADEPLQANTPYLFMPNANEAAFAGVGTVAAASEESVTKDGYSLTGIYQEKTDMADCGAYALAGGVFRQAESNSVTLAPFRVFVTAPTYNSVKKLPVKVGGSDGINAIEADRMEQGVFYDLQGRKVANPGHGFYIFNGMKVLVK